MGIIHSYTYNMTMHDWNLFLNGELNPLPVPVFATYRVLFSAHVEEWQGYHNETRQLKEWSRTGVPPSLQRD